MTARGTDVSLAPGKAEEAQASSEAPPLPLHWNPGHSHAGPVQGGDPGRLQGEVRAEQRIIKALDTERKFKGFF